MEKGTNIRRIIIFCVILTLIVGSFIGYIVYKGPTVKVSETKEPPQQAEKKEKAAPQIAEKVESATVDYNRIEKDAEYKRLMQMRKEKYGLEKSVDLIVKEDESIKIGDSTIPMKEILERIRLSRSGEVIEKDMGGKEQSALFEKQMKDFSKNLQDIVSKTGELDAKLNDTAIGADHPQYRKIMEEYRKIITTAEDYQKAQSITEEIQEQKMLLEKNEETIRQRLNEEIADFEKLMEQQIADLVKLIPDPVKVQTAASDRKRFLDSLEPIREKLSDLEKKLADPEFLKQPEMYGQSIRERNRLRAVADILDRCTELERKIDDRKDLLGDNKGSVKVGLARKIEDLRIQHEFLVNELWLRIMPTDSEHIYGIYVVQLGDNIWNIHFNFLKEYFSKKGITLSSIADEPITVGVSSGIGKILKFSETMVFIYNLREKKLNFDLNLINPLSKIVVFNMGKALSLLEQIDYTNISHIRFDGETLWLPAER